MKKFLISILLTLACLLCAQEPKFITMEIAQNKFVDMFDEPLNAKIFAAADDEGNLRWETLAPYKSVIICNARGVFEFEFADGKWRKLNTNSSEAVKKIFAQTSAIVIGNFAQFYDVKNLADKFELTPKNEMEKLAVKKIAVYVKDDSKIPNKIEIFYANSDRAVLEITKVKINKDADKSLFNEKAFN